MSPVSMEIVRLHHERCNGTGYPLKLQHRDIPRSAQVAAVADVVCGGSGTRRIADLQRILYAASAFS